ncbi:hypothetical protein AWJ20_1092 [Sugiyamaella lignohabitans]|uniref:Velvet domain-containing protein n=1 Tax=Sugiyamaella lignohabitans TaxID=796027 RepID=A0A167DED0_9ASCO|nr:uncharacterized protein AWJ20_1092 [Sugiyamaella lignohabitans]ANB12820.1 hypothetical protein AWJ20_1092 [Sugiyamaella lignohabitans]
MDQNPQNSYNPSSSLYNNPAHQNSDTIHNRFRFELEISQEPVRSRMCGFGDKDRRLISPPPCVQLKIYDRETGAPYEDITHLDVSFYALLVELWTVDETTNLSSVVQSPKAMSGPGASSRGSEGLPGSGRSQIVRNLIGTLVATAFKLYNLDDNLGIWFVLHDLSVRIEGEYKLKFSFVRLSSTPGSNPAVPVLCESFSQPFRSYSAKKFPGVIDTTELSRYFALQGIRIPIRRLPKPDSDLKHSK